MSWQVRESDDDTYEVYQIVDGVYTTIATVHKAFGMGEQNARLIAHAPDMARTLGINIRRLNAVAPQGEPPEAS